MTTITEMVRCFNEDSCDPGQEHVFPVTGEEVTLFADAYRIVGTPEYRSFATGPRGIVVNRLNESHQVLVDIDGVGVWADIDADIDWEQMECVPDAV